MAKTQKYSEDKLLEAVIRYADTFKGKIQATKLAKWASANIDGLEGVRDYHFMRPVIEKDPKTGNNITRAKICTERIEELNLARSTETAVNINPLLKSSNIDMFFTLPKHEQRQLIIDTRAQVDKLLLENKLARKENAVVGQRVKEQSSQIDELSNLLLSVSKKQDALLSAVSRALKSLDESQRRAVLAEIGVSNEGLDLNAYTDSLTLDVKKAFSINHAIKGNISANSDTTAESLMEGIEF